MSALRGTQTDAILRIIGQKQDSPGLRELLHTVKTRPEISKFSDCYFHSYKEHGISLRFNTRGRVDAVILYAEGADGYGQYAGDPPYGIHLTDTRADVEQKLGEAPKSGPGVNWPFWVTYPDLGLHVTYWGKSPTDLSNRIHHLLIREPD
jgi:hypothetical protein